MRITEEKLNKIITECVMEACELEGLGNYFGTKEPQSLEEVLAHYSVGGKIAAEKPIPGGRRIGIQCGAPAMMKANEEELSEMLNDFLNPRGETAVFKGFSKVNHWLVFDITENVQ